MHPKTLKHNPVSPEVEALFGKHNNDPEALLGVYSVCVIQPAQARLLHIWLGI